MAGLTDEAVAAIKGMLLRGDKHMDIATYFGVNQARVSEIRTGKGMGRKSGHVPFAPAEILPPPGPYVLVARTVVDELRVKELAQQQLVAELEVLLARYKGQETDCHRHFNGVRLHQD